MVSWSCFVACAGFSPWTRVCSTMPVGLRVVTALPPLSGRGPAQPVAISAAANPAHRRRESLGFTVIHPSGGKKGFPIGEEGFPSPTFGENHPHTRPSDWL